MYVIDFVFDIFDVDVLIVLSIPQAEPPPFYSFALLSLYFHTWSYLSQKR